VNAEFEHRRERLSPTKLALLERLQNGASASLPAPPDVRERTGPATREIAPGPLIMIRAGKNRPPLFCVHAVSGSPYSYVELSRLLDGSQPVYGIEAAGFDNDRAPIASIGRLATTYVSAIEELCLLDGCCLLGWSMGGVIAFDMAQQLDAAGFSPAVLILIDTPVPTPGEVPAECDLLQRFMRELLGGSARSMPELDAILGRHTGEVDPGRVLAEVDAAGLAPADMNAEFLEHRYRVFRANVEAMFGYRVIGEYSGPSTLIKGSESPARCMQWQAVVRDLEIHTVAGDHHSIWTGDSLVTLAAVVQHCLQRGQSATWR
jgi:thioesterase domain-containing protein